MIWDLTGQKGSGEGRSAWRSSGRWQWRAVGVLGWCVHKKSSALPFIGKGGKDKLAGERGQRSGKPGAWALARRR